MLGLGIFKKLRYIFNIFCLFKYKLFRFLFGVNTANSYLTTVDKYALVKIVKYYGAHIGSNCDIESPLYFHNCKKFSNLTVGNDCHIGKCVFLDLRNHIKIQNKVTISMNTIIITHQDMGRSPLSKIYHPLSKPVLIKEGAYIGANATILMGVTIGKCSIIGADALVNQNVDDFTMVAGVPARFIKSTYKMIEN